MDRCQAGAGTAGGYLLLRATMLYLLGLDHTRLTRRYLGRDFRLIDVYGSVVKEILA